MFHEPLRLDKKGRYLKFSERSLFHKFARALYRFMRVIYVSVIFYFVPFLILAIEFMGWLKDEEHHESAETYQIPSDEFAFI
jgi:hypothetical protein